MQSLNLNFRKLKWENSFENTYLPDQTLNFSYNYLFVCYGVRCGEIVTELRSSSSSLQVRNTVTIKWTFS